MNRWKGKSVAQEKPGKGKSVVQEEPQEEEEENPPWKEFTLKMGDLKGTYPAMMEQIEATMKKMLEDETKIQPAHERMPLTVSGRIYTPAPGSGMFLVRLEPDQTQGGKVAILLIRWSDLYILAFYVKAVWYLYNDFDGKILPPQSQLPYKSEAGVGVIKLPISSSYGDIGGFQIKVGKPSFSHCILTLGKIGELYSSKHGLKVLKSGPLSLPTITISEAIRFDLWRNWVIDHMDRETDSEVPVEHNSLFNHWSDISEAVASNESWRGRTLAELVKIVSVLLRNQCIKPVSESSSSRSRKK